MNCRVVVEAAVPVYDVETADEAVRIAISKTGEMLNPDLNYVEINMGSRACPNCGQEHDPAFIAADESLVALELEMTVFNVEREEHASRIARKEIGQRLENIPLEVLEIEVLEDDDEDDDDDDEDHEEDDEDDGDLDEEVEQEVEDSGDEPADSSTHDDGDDGSATASGAESVSADDDSPSASGDGGTAVDRAAEEISSEGEAGADDGDETGGGEDRSSDDVDDEVLPEFDELIDE